MATVIRTTVGDHIRRIHGDLTTLSVDALEKSLRQAKYEYDRTEIVHLLKTYEKEGFGHFYTGRRGRPSRILWKNLPRDVPGLAAPKQSPIGTSAPLLEHLVPLRKDLVAKLALPSDLTKAEAARVSQFVQLLPLS